MTPESTRRNLRVKKNLSSIFTEIQEYIAFVIYEQSSLKKEQSENVKILLNLKYGYKCQNFTRNNRFGKKSLRNIPECTPK